jgi:hypothetical protein
LTEKAINRHLSPGRGSSYAGVNSRFGQTRGVPQIHREN